MYSLDNDFYRRRWVMRFFSGLKCLILNLGDGVSRFFSAALEGLAEFSGAEICPMCNRGHLIRDPADVVINDPFTHPLMILPVKVKLVCTCCTYHVTRDLSARAPN